MCVVLLHAGRFTRRGGALDTKKFYRSRGGARSRVMSIALSTQYTYVHIWILYICTYIQYKSEATEVFTRRDAYIYVYMNNLYTRARAQSPQKIFGF